MMMKNLIFVLVCVFCVVPCRSWQFPADWLTLNSSLDLVISHTQCATPPPSFGNGYLSAVYTGWCVAKTPTFMYSAGLFTHSTGGNDRLPIPISFVIGEVSGVGEAVAYDFRYSSVEELVSLPYASCATVRRRVYFHRQSRNLIVVDLTVNATACASNVTVQWHDSFGVPAGWQRRRDPRGGPAQCWSMSGIPHGEDGAVSTAVALCRDPLPPVVSVPGGQLWRGTMLSSVVTNASVPNSPPGSQGNDTTLLDVATSVLSSNRNISPDRLLAAHAAAQATVAVGNIAVEGNEVLALVINASLAALTASMREDVFWSTSPGGLATDGYQGAVFWDMETWMWPNLALFRPGLAAAAMNYRGLTRSGAAAKAESLGYGGSQAYEWAWESGATGRDVSPWLGGATNEVHINADVVLAAAQWWWLGAPKNWLRDVGLDLLVGTAQFIVQRVVILAEGVHTVHVCGPDEYHSDVTDSAYVNFAFSKALELIDDLVQSAARIGITTQRTLPSNLSTVAAGLLKSIPYDAQYMYHPEFRNYSRGTAVKQADTVMLTYPWAANFSSTVLLNDALYYAANTPGGPAMTWAVFYTALRQLGRDDAADSFFGATYNDNVYGPYYAWTEMKGGGGCPNFLTGAGAFLQGIWAGAGGLRITPRGLTFAYPAPPPNATSLALNGISFQSFVFDFKVTQVSDSQAHSYTSCFRLSEKNKYFGSLFVITENCSDCPRVTLSKSWSCSSKRRFLVQV